MPYRPRLRTSLSKARHSCLRRTPRRPTLSHRSGECSCRLFLSSRRPRRIPNTTSRQLILLRARFRNCTLYHGPRMTLQLKGCWATGPSQTDRHLKMARAAKAGAAAWPRGLHLGCFYLKFPDRRGSPRGRPGPKHMGHFLRAAGLVRQSRHRRHRLRPLPSLCRGHSADEGSRRAGLSFFSGLASPSARGARSANEAGLAFYDRLIDALLEARIEPWLCLYHWDLPQVLDDLGGWTVRDAAGWFADYAMLVARRYGDRVKRFATFNEPSVFTLFGYGFGTSAPRNSGPVMFRRAIHHVNLAHGAAVDVIRAQVPDALIGAIHNYQPCLPATPADAAAAELFGAYWNGAFADPQCTRSEPTHRS